MERHVHVIARDGKRLATYPISIGTEEAERREVEYFEEARRRARDEKSRRARSRSRGPALRVRDRAAIAAMAAVSAFSPLREKVPEGRMRGRAVSTGRLRDPSSVSRCT